MGWDIRLWHDVEEWLIALDSEDFDLVAAAIDHLEEHGPSLGRPLVDRIHGARHHNMKELRPGSTSATEVRILFAFDPHRQAILLVAGDKAGRWRDWYRTNVPLADERLDEWLRRESE